MKKAITLITLSLALFSLSGCSTLPQSQGILEIDGLTTLETPKSDLPLWQPEKLPLRSGQIIVSESGNDYSLFFSLFPERFSPYIHTGIIVIVNGVPFVYEGLGSLGIFLGSSPTDKIEGHIKRRSLDQYIREENYVAIYDLPDNVDRKKVVQFAIDNFNNRTPFDPYMNSLDHEKLYCAEFVAQALLAGGLKEITLTPYRKNRSLEIVHKWLKVTDKSVIQAGSLVNTDKHVATLSTRLSPREIQLYIAARQELHSRFTNNQKLGNLFEWTGFRLKVRPPIAQFKEASMQLFKDDPAPDWQTTRRAVQKLANQILGPYSAEADRQHAQLNINPALPCFSKEALSGAAC